MGKKSVLVATIPGMITEPDLEPIKDLADVKYHEVNAISQSELASLCSGADVLMLNYDVVKSLEADFYENQNIQRLSSISTDITGMDWSNPGVARKNGITLQHIPHYSTESVAETIVLEVLLHSRRRLEDFKDAIRGDVPKGRQGINLQNRIAGVIGYGSIGQRVSELLNCLGMEVLVWNRSPKLGVGTENLETIFTKADVICLTTATDKSADTSNVGFVSENLLSKCESTIVVNLAGAQLVDNSAMMTALDAQRVVGYSVEGTPELRASKLAEYDQVNLPPHSSWKSPESLENLKNIWIRNTISALTGNPDNVFTG